MRIFLFSLTLGLAVGCDQKPSDSATTTPSETSVAVKKQDQEDDDSRARLTSIKIQESKLKEDLQAAQASDISKLHASAAWIDAKKKADDLLAKLEAVRKAGAMDERLKVSSEYTKAAAIVKKMEADAIGNDPAIAKSKRDLSDITSRRQTIEGEIESRILSEATARRDTELNDPVKKAIRLHRLIEGMSYEEAIEAIGKPYSITHSGNFISATWHTGDTYWSASFIDGKASAISQTRL